MTTVIWNYDSDDWNIGTGPGITLDSVEAGMQKVLAGPKSPGLIILEHEISADDVSNFIASYPLMQSNNWPVKSIPELTGANWYQNSKDNVSPVTPMDHFAQYPPKPTTATPSSTAAVVHSSSDTTVATSTTAVTNPQNNLAGASSPTSSPRLWNTLVFLTLTLGAYYL